jgi:membrane protein DedA with SNARE-associated domain
METLLAFIQHYGYAFVFFATLFEGETVVALAGFTAYEQYLDFETVMFVAFLGGMMGDQIFFYFGRWKGKQFIESRPKFVERAKRVHRLIERYPNFLIFASRFMYGFRVLIPVAFGTSRVTGVRFFVFNLLGAATWSAIFTSLGYFLGNALETYLGNFHKAEKYVVLGMIVGVLLVQGISLLYKRIDQRVERVEKHGDEDALDNHKTSV